MVETLEKITEFECSFDGGTLIKNPDGSYRCIDCGADYSPSEFKRFVVEPQQYRKSQSRQSSPNNSN